MEIIDVFDETGQPLTPPTATIDAVHRQGLWHRTFACWIVNPDTRTVLWQQRGARNRIDPHSFDASASGHLTAGENPADGFREVEEELGLVIPPAARSGAGCFRNVAIRGKYINREFCHVFLGKSTAAPHDLTLQHGEVAGVFAVDITAAIEMFAGRTQKITAQGVVREDTTGGKSVYKPAQRDIAVADMCNWHERVVVTRYYLKAMQAAQACLNGEKDPAI